MKENPRQASGMVSSEGLKQAVEVQRRTHSYQVSLAGQSSMLNVIAVILHSRKSGKLA